MPTHSIKQAISCQCPKALWKDVRKLAEFEEVTATQIVIRALQKEVNENRLDNDHEFKICNTFVNVGDRIMATNYNGVDYTNFLVALKDEVPGIYCKNSISDFKPLSSFKRIIILEKGE